jgi:thioredoxin-dependent peroxiredoxin
MEDWGAFGEKKSRGKITRGVIRSTVVIGRDGKVARHWPKVTKAADHPAKVLEYLQGD